MAQRRSGQRRRRPQPVNAFRDAVDQAEFLRYRVGLSAIVRGEGKGQITASDNASVLGSVNVDTDCKSAFRKANRWDYAIGYSRSDGPVVFYVEVHCAHSHNVGEMAKKLTWLIDFLNREANRALSLLDREYWWVASGKVNIPKHVPQYRRLQTLGSKHGLQGPKKHLQLQ